MKSRLVAGVVVRLFESGSERRLSEFLIGTSNQSEILRENVGFQFLSQGAAPLSGHSRGRSIDRRETMRDGSLR
jgi:hypothetical protein